MVSAADKPRPFGAVHSAADAGAEEARMQASSEWKSVKAVWGKGSDWIAASKALVAAFLSVSYGHEVYGEALASLHLYAEAVVELKRAIELCPR